MSSSIYQREQSATKLANVFGVKTHRSETLQYSSNACQDPDATIDCVILQLAFLECVLRWNERTVHKIGCLRLEDTKPSCRPDFRQVRVRGLSRSGADDALDRRRADGRESGGLLV